MPLMRINYYIYAGDEKAGFRNWERLLSKSTLARSMYPHLTSVENILRSRFWQCFVREATTDNQSSHWNDRRGQLREEVGGCRKRSSAFLIPRQRRVQKQSNWLTKWILIQSTFWILSMSSGADFGLTTEAETSWYLQCLFRCVLAGTLTFWLTRNTERPQRIDQYIALQYNSR